MDAACLLILLLATLFKVTGTQARQDLCDLEACKCTLDGKINCNCAYTSVKRIDINKEGQANSSLPLRVSVVQIENCEHVTLNSHALKRLQALQRVDIVNVQAVHIETMGLAWDEDTHYGMDQRSVAIRFVRSSLFVGNFAFQGSIHEISFTDVHFSIIKSYAFTNLKTLDRIQLSGCKVDTIELQAFKKISMDKLIIENTRFLSSVPSRTWFELTVRKELKLYQVVWEQLSSLSFDMHVGNTVKIESSYFNLIEGDAFHLKVKGDVFIEDNYFHDMRDRALYGISTLDSREDSELLFQNNTVHIHEDLSLQFNSTYLRVRVTDIVYNSACVCTAQVLYVDKIQCEHSHQLVNYSAFLRQQCEARASRTLQVYALIILLTLAACVGAGVYVYKKAYYQYFYRLLNIGTVKKRKLKKPKVMKNGVKPTIVVLPYTNDLYRETEYHVLPEKLQPIQPIENEMAKLHSIQTDM